MFKLLLKYKIVAVFLGLGLLFIPLSLYQPAETESMAVVTSVGLDKMGDLIEVSINAVVPNTQASGSGGVDGTVKTISATGKNVDLAFERLTIIIGKMPGLAHCDSIVLNKQLFENNVLEYLDYFTRTNNLTSNATLIVAENSAKEILEVSAQQKGVRAVSLSDILLLNNQYAITEQSNLDKFYLNYFSSASVSILPVLSTGDSNKADDEQVDSNTQQKTDDEQKPEGESGSGAPTKILKNKGEAIVVKKGKFVADLKNKEMRGFNLISKNTKKGKLQVNNVTALGFNNANLTFEVFNKKIKTSGKFVNGKPFFNFDIDLILKLEEVGSNNLNLENMSTSKNYVDGQIKTEIDKTMQNYMAQIINYSKQNKVDILGVYDYFYKFETKKWLQFINGLTDKNDYLNHVTFTCNISKEGKI